MTTVPTSCSTPCRPASPPVAPTIVAGCMGRGGGVVPSVQVEGHGAGDAVHGHAEDLDIVERSAAVCVNDQGAVDRRGALEGAGVGGGGGDIGDQVAAGLSHAVGGRRRVSNCSA